jgi:pectate lyase
MFGSTQLVLASLVAALPTAFACLGYEGGVPVPTASHSNSKVIEIAAGQTFDAGWAKYDRGSGACNGDSEGDWEDAVFYLHKGATLKNVIIGKNQAEGVHCDGPCNLEFVWFEDVCEDAITIVSLCCCSSRSQFYPNWPEKKNDKSGEETWIIGGGAYHASDKIVQHNGCGTVNVSASFPVLESIAHVLQIINFYAEDYGKVYRSCGNVSTCWVRLEYGSWSWAQSANSVLQPMQA